jgi:transcription antitermination factor NusG
MEPSEKAKVLADHQSSMVRAIREETNPATKWVILWVKPASEEAVRDEVSSLGHEVFVPMLRTRKKTPRRLLELHGPFTVVTTPAIPGYVFANLNPALPDPGDPPIRNVIRIIRCGSNPGQSRLSREIDVLRQAEARGDYDLLEIESEAHARWVSSLVGQAVDIAKGPFAGKTGICEARSGDKLMIRFGNMRTMMDCDFLKKSA